MHSTQGPSGLYYHHNGDYSGDVKVTIPMMRRELYTWGSGTVQVEIDEPRQQVTVDIPFEDMRHLVLSHYRSLMTGRLENADDKELERLLRLNWEES